LDGTVSGYDASLVAQYVVDANDPFPEGYTIGDIWGGN
jgi:proline racemase